MNSDMNIRWGWLKIMYWYTIIGAGGFGLAMVLFPETIRSLFKWPSQDPIVYGVTGSVWVAFGVLSIICDTACRHHGILHHRRSNCDTISLRFFANKHSG